MNFRSKQPGPGHLSTTKKPRVRIRQYLPAKLRVRCKVYNPEDKELTFRPTINKKSSHLRMAGPKQPKENFAARMQRDISKRRSQSCNSNGSESSRTSKKLRVCRLSS